MQSEHMQLPSLLAKSLADCTWQATSGCSGATVYRLTRPDQSQLYLKMGPHDPNRSLAAEHARLIWLAGQLPVPRVHLFLQENQFDYLLMSALPGLDTSDPAYRADLPAMVHELAAGLRQLHSLPIQHCPFDERLNSKLAQARARTGAGLVDATLFHEQFQGRTATDLLVELEATRPSTEDLVFTHGDYCLPNILLQHGKLSGFIDLGRAGVADRYQDLALAAQSIKRNVGATWIPRFLAAYDIEAEPNKLKYYQMLDEFF